MGKVYVISKCFVKMKTNGYFPGKSRKENFQNSLVSETDIKIDESKIGLKLIFMLIQADFQLA